MSERHRWRVMVISVLLLNVWAGIVVAAPLRTIGYQGYLKDGSGLPVTTTVNLTFALYSSLRPVSGPIWRESQNVTPVNGVYSAELGTLFPLSPLPFDRQYFLGVAVGSAAEMTPRQPLSATAYAFRAGVAESVMGSSIGAAAIVNGSITADKLDTAYVRVAGDTMSGLLNLPTGGLKVGGTELVVSGGKVGIGIAAPTESLDVIGNVKISGTLSAGSLAPGVVTAGALGNNSITTAAIANSAVTTAKIADGAITSDKIADVQRTLPFPAGSLSYPPGSSIISAHAFGLLFKNDYANSATLTIPRLSDWTGAGSVIVHLFVYVSTQAPGTLQFFMRPRVYASGDPNTDVVAVLSDVITVTAGDKFYELKIVIAAGAFGVKPWWNLILQRNPLTYLGDAVVTSVALEYTAVR